MKPIYRPSGALITKADFVPTHITADYVIGLAGNPNTGKSTVFNTLTGLNQHTGNWPGKTVSQARGFYRHQGKNVILVDYRELTLLANSIEEEVARILSALLSPMPRLLLSMPRVWNVI